MDPITVWNLAKGAGEIANKLYELSKRVKDRELQHEIDQILDHVRELKHSASKLEDENRELREQLRFKSDDYEFDSPFWFDKKHPERPLCPKCFAKGILAPMGKPGFGCTPSYCLCLVCGNPLEHLGKHPAAR